MRKKVLYLAFLLCAVWGLCVTADAAEIVDNGDCGDNASYTLDSDGLLTISGTGEIYR